MNSRYLRGALHLWGSIPKLWRNVPKLGTGVLGVAPVHSQIDFEIAQTYNLPLVQIIGEDGRMTETAGPYAGLTIEECRTAFVNDLHEADY